MTNLFGLTGVPGPLYEVGGGEDDEGGEEAGQQGVDSVGHQPGQQQQAGAGPVQSVETDW